MNQKIVLGIHCGYEHDAGAAVIVDGRVAAAMAEERVSRRKKDPFFPRGAIQKCLEKAAVNAADVNLVCLGAKDIQFIPEDQVDLYFKGVGGSFTLPVKARTVREIADVLKTRRQYHSNIASGRRPFHDRLVRELRDMGVATHAEYLYVDHHDAHLASVYFTSGALDATDGYTFVVDGYGDGKSVSVYRFSGEPPTFRSVLTMPATCSPGLMYSGVTKFLGMTPNRHEGKVTGLAGRGDPSQLYAVTEKYLRYHAPARRFIVSAAQESRVATILRTARNLIGGRQWKPNPMEQAFQRDFAGHTKEDIAAAVQRRFDDEILAFFRDIVGHDKPRAIFLAGGIFANVILNAKVAQEYPGTEVYVHPGMTDEGIALGAALWGDWKVNGNASRRVLTDVYLGSDYSKDLAALLQKRAAGGYHVEELNFNQNAGADRVAELIDCGKAVGIFYGGMEYGPRALGARTIMADPRDPDINDRLNARMRRSEFMPFAPVVMKEHCQDVFQLPQNLEYTSNFMTCVCRVRDEWRARVPAIVHVDGTARPQLISQTQNPVYYSIIKAFWRRTGIPLLINTSFNAHEEPIVESFEDACGALRENVIDYVLAPPYLISLA